MAIEYKYISSLCIFLLTPIYAYAQDDTKVNNYTNIDNYSGSYSCKGENYTTYTQIESDNNQYIITIARKKNGEAYSDILSLTAKKDNNPSIIFHDENNIDTLKISKTENDKDFTAEWLQNTGNAKEDCTNFTLNLSDDVAKKYQSLIEKLHKSPATLDNAEILAKAQYQSPPSAFLDPETITRYQQASNDFWQKFYQQELQNLAKMPLNNKQQAKLLVDEMQRATALNLHPDGKISADNDSDSKKFAITALRLVDDRLNQADYSIPALKFSSPQEICDRYAVFQDNTVESFELILGINSDYWSLYANDKNTPLNDNLSSKLLQCTSPDTRFAFYQIFKEAEKKYNNGQYLLQQVKKIQNTAENIAAYKASNYLQLNNTELARRGISEETVARLVGDKLAVKNAHMQQVLQENLNASFVTNADLAEFSQEQIDAHCKDLLEYDEKDNGPLKTLYQQCQNIGQMQAESLLTNKMQTIIAIAANSNKSNVAGDKSDDVTTTPVAILLENQWLDSNLIAAPLVIGKDFSPKLLKELEQLQKSTIKKAEKFIHDSFAKISLVEAYPTILSACDEIVKSDLAASTSLQKICTQEMKTYTSNREKYLCDTAVKEANLSEKMLNKDIYFEMNNTRERIKLRALICRLGLHNISTQILDTGQMFTSTFTIEFQQKNSDSDAVLIEKARLTTMKRGFRLVNIIGTNTMSWLKSFDILEKK